MSLPTLGALVIVWWNTSLSPPIAGTRASERDELEFAVAQLRDIRQQVGFDVLALGEVRSTDVSAIVEGLGDSNLSVHDATDHTGRLKFDTAVIYDRSKLSIESGGGSIIDKFGSKTLKTGEVLVFRVIATGDPLILIVSHWPSRRSAPESSSVRAELGMALRRYIERVHEIEAEPYIVLVGDYNDDPFSPSLANHLLATRDRSLARRNKRFLYNPFWRKMGESHANAESDDTVGYCGTHYYSRGDHSQWFTFDQIIFSSAFLNGASMNLNEELCGIVAPIGLRAKMLNRGEIFDHFPVLGTIELRSKL